MPFETAGLTSGRQYTAIDDRQSDQTFLMQYIDNESPRFDGNVYDQVLYGGETHKGVDIQGLQLSARTCTKVTTCVSTQVYTSMEDTSVERRSCAG